MAWFRVEFGAESLHRPLALPTAEFFPGPYPGLERTFTRCLSGCAEHVGVDPDLVVVAYFGEHVPC